MHSRWEGEPRSHCRAEAPAGRPAKAPTLVRICASPAYNEARAECFGKIGYWGVGGKILLHFLWSKGEKCIHYFDIIKISCVWNANLPDRNWVIL